jgi:enoyl-CoA hydratase/carnithine racemase
MPALVYEKKGRVAHIILNRPEARNAMNAEVWDGLVKSWIDVRDDPEVWVAIVSATGDKAFSSGQDLKEVMEWMKIPEDKRPAQPLPEVNPMRGLETYKPIIAAINGICTGGGLELAMACDIRIAADTARLGLAETKQSVIPANSGTQKLIRLVPFGKAMEMLITGDFIDAQEAYRIGLVNKVVPFAQLMPEAEALAARICENGPCAVRAVKELALRGIETSLAEGLKMEIEMSKRLAQTEDSQEGPRAFAEKRKPIWKGR